MSQPTTSRHAAGTELTLGDIQELFEELGLSMADSPLATGYMFYKRLQREYEERQQLMAEVAELVGVSPVMYRAMSRKERREHDERRLKLAHREVVIPTANIATFEDTLRQALRVAEYSQRELQGGIVVQGEAGVGKSTALLNITMKLAGKFYEDAFGPDWWRQPVSSLKVPHRSASGDQARVPAVFALPITFTSNPTPATIAKGMLASLASCTLDPKLAKMVGKQLKGEAQFMDALVPRLFMHGVKVVVIDELHFVRGDKNGDHVVNLLKSLLDRSRVVLVMAGVSKTSGLEIFTDSKSKNPTRQQLLRRLVVLDFDPFEQYRPMRGSKGTTVGSNPEWLKVINLMAGRLILLDQPSDWWLQPATLKYLWQRTQGVFTSLNTLLEGASHAVIGGPERFTIELLEKIHISHDADGFAAEKYKIGPRYRGWARSAGIDSGQGVAASARESKVTTNLRRQGFAGPRRGDGAQDGQVE